MIQDLENMPVQEVIDKIEETESHVWDEYVSHGAIELERFPSRFRWIAVYVVSGGSEGLYLHIDVIGTGVPRNRALVILGKTCDASPAKWKACWESAGRIADLLGA